jgi:hypothetical protein
MKRKTRDIPAQTRSTTRTRRESNEGINFVDFLDNIIKFLCYYNIRQKNIHYIFENLYLKYVIQDRQDGNHDKQVPEIQGHQGGSHEKRVSEIQGRQDGNHNKQVSEIQDHQGSNHESRQGGNHEKRVSEIQDESESQEDEDEDIDDLAETSKKHSHDSEVTRKTKKVTGMYFINIIVQYAF